MHTAVSTLSFHPLQYMSPFAYRLSATGVGTVGTFAVPGTISFSSKAFKTFAFALLSLRLNLYHPCYYRSRDVAI